MSQEKSHNITDFALLEVSKLHIIYIYIYMFHWCEEGCGGVMVYTRGKYSGTTNSPEGPGGEQQLLAVSDTDKLTVAAGGTWLTIQLVGRLDLRLLLLCTFMWIFMFPF